jgi:protein-S-isoprenylcysteine O-methyltransferase Ste14
MIKLIVFISLSIPVFILSYKSLLKRNSHGFYRFFGWECILWLLVCNIPYWFTDAFCLHQILSWLLMSISLYMILAGVFWMRKMGKPDESRKDESLYTFEKTSVLVQQGIFRYIRHPLYSSLLFLAWGVYLKQPSLQLLPAVFASSVFLFLTAWFEEKENIRYFGETYREYMRHTKRFIPFVF